MVILILSAFAVFVTAYSRNISDVSMQQGFRFRHDTRYTEHIAGSAGVDTHLECAWYCMDTPGCLAANYGPLVNDSHPCGLIDHMTQDGALFQSAIGWQLFLTSPPGCTWYYPEDTSADSCYLVVEVYHDYSEAQAQCSAAVNGFGFTGYLANMETEQERAFLYSRLLTHEWTPTYWQVGLVQEAGAWMWNRSRKPMDAPVLFAGMRDPTHCGWIYVSQGRDPTFYRLPCGNTKPYVCEFELN